MTRKYIQKKGFTLIEVMVATAIFVIIITVGIGALLNVIDGYNRSQDKKIVADNLNFLIEGMSREIRLGTNYYSNPPLDGSTEGFIKNGSDSSIGFSAVEDRGYFIYYLDNETLYRMRFESGSQYKEQLTDPSQVIITDMDFNVVGANDPIVDEKQAFVNIFIQGRSSGGDIGMAVQSMVSQRRLDM